MMFAIISLCIGLSTFDMVKCEPMEKLQINSFIIYIVLYIREVDILEYTMIRLHKVPFCYCIAGLEMTNLS